ncbi:gag-pol polyprotein [Tanacetum coccineum]
MELCYPLMEKMVQALVHTTRSMRGIFRKLKVNVVTDRPMEEILKLFGREGWLAKWAAEVRTYDISGNIQPKQEASGKINPNTKGLEVIPGQRNNQIFSGVGIILVSPKERMLSYAIRLKFNTFGHAIDCKALLAGLVASVSKGMKDLHVFMNLTKLVTQKEGNHKPATKQERKYKNEITGATVPFHRFQITHLPKNFELQSKSVKRIVNHKVGISQ